jgi:hypothetical protein
LRAIFLRAYHPHQPVPVTNGQHADIQGLHFLGGFDQGSLWANYFRIVRDYFINFHGVYPFFLIC